MVKELKAVLFDFDGVVIDTEGQYTQFWDLMGDRFFKAGKDFGTKVKGQTLTTIFKEYIPDPEAQKSIRECLDVFEKKMHFNDIPGSTDFVKAVRKAGFKTAVVTSSDHIKMGCVYEQRPELPEIFDHIFTAEDCSSSKPSPDCFINAAHYFGFAPEECIVLEDSVNGLKAARASGSFVVGLSTTNSIETVSEYADIVIPDFIGFTVDSLKAAFAAGR